MMVVLAILLKLVLATLVSLLLAVLAFIYAWAERQVAARSQQRHGIAFLPVAGLSVLAADFIKLIFKRSADRSSVGTFLAGLSAFLPFLFFIYLFQALGQFDGGRGELFLLFFVLLMGIWVQKVLVFLAIEERERFSFDQSYVLLLTSGAALFLSLLPIILVTGSASLAAADRAQESFPFCLLLSSPGTFLSALTSFVSLVFLLRLGPAGLESEQFIASGKGRWFFWVQRLWIICVVSLWVYINLGGGPIGALAFFSFILRLALVLGIFLWIQASFPRGRSSDLSHFVLRALVPISLVAVIVELLWLAGPGRNI